MITFILVAVESMELVTDDESEVTKDESVVTGLSAGISQQMEMMLNVRN